MSSLFATCRQLVWLKFHHGVLLCGSWSSGQVWKLHLRQRERETERDRERKIEGEEIERGRGDKWMKRGRSLDRDSVNGIILIKVLQTDKNSPAPPPPFKNTPSYNPCPPPFPTNPPSNRAPNLKIREGPLSAKKTAFTNLVYCRVSRCGAQKIIF